ncbi:MAG: alpha/beta fold hydrolase [Chryseolinea sp.]
MESINITASDGYELSALFGSAVGRCQGSVIISSATSIRKEFYINFASFLNENGYNVLLFDYRGIGGSAPNDLKSANFFMHEWGTFDMNAALNYLVYEKQLTNIIWVGHSIGGQLVGFIENQRHLKKIVTVNAGVGYWGYFPFPMSIAMWVMWHLVSPVILKWYGYGMMRKIGWGEDLPRNTILEWKGWCTNKDYYMPYLHQKLNVDRFYHITIPVTSIYTSDDYLANDRTVPLMMEFFPNAPVDIRKIIVDDYTDEKVGHNGIFRRKFRTSLWPLLINALT